MATYIQIYDLRDNVNLRKQVAVGCRVAAQDIQNEAVGTANHAARLNWAKAIQDGTAPGLVERMISAVTMNATIQAAAPAGPFLDSDVQFSVNSFLATQVG